MISGKQKFYVTQLEDEQFYVYVNLNEDEQIYEIYLAIDYWYLECYTWRTLATPLDFITLMQIWKSPYMFAFI